MLAINMHVVSLFGHLRSLQLAHALLLYSETSFLVASSPFDTCL